jgi:hypothetical protein
MVFSWFTLPALQLCDDRRCEERCDEAISWRFSGSEAVICNG